MGHASFSTTNIDVMSCHLIINLSITTRNLFRLFHIILSLGGEQWNSKLGMYDILRNLNLSRYVIDTFELSFVLIKHLINT